ncbi:MAG: hypothetical protein HY553_08470 [Elusimicrobia bacterium]|nr:hypothetical protein [Elusimicrobiota bacterium]
MTQPGEPVRSGEFLIDRERALKILARYQLESPLLFPLAWVRAASAAGARGVELADGKDAFSLRFDGRAFTGPELAALLSHLPEEGSEPRLRELARGAATAVTQAEAVLIASGEGASRVLCRATKEGEAVAPAEDAEARTVIAARWPGGRRPAAFDATIQALRRRVIPGFATFQGASTPVGALPHGYWQRFGQEGLAGWLSPTPAGLRGSELFLYHWGVSCGQAPVDLAGHPDVRAVVDAPDIGLDLSQGKVLRDARYDRLIERVGRAADAFAGDAARRLSRVLPAIGQWLGDPVAYKTWKEQLTGVSESLDLDGVLLDAQRYFALDAGTAKERLGDLRRWGPIVAWMRATAVRLLGHGRSPQSDIERVLWTAPLFLTVDGLPLTPAEIERQFVRLGRLAIAERAYAGDAPVRPIIDVSGRRQALELLVGTLGDRVNP